MSSDNICPIVSPLGSAHSKPVNVFLAKRAAILLTKPGRVSDSWTTIFLRRSAAAKTTGSATYHHLQKTMVIR